MTIRSKKPGTVPLYEQIKRRLRHDIEAGILLPGQLLPAQQELAEQHKVSDITIRRALQDLAREKWVSRVSGVGTFVRKKVEPARVALVLPGFGDVQFWRDRSKDFGGLMAGIGEVAWEYWAMFSVIRTEETASIERFIAEQKEQRSVDGVLIKPNGEIDPPIFDLLEQASLPFVVINRKVNERPVSSVVGDDFSEAQMLTTHLIEQGCTRIGFIGPPPGELFRHRYGGYVAALRDHGVPYLDELVVQAQDFDSQHGALWVSRLLDLPTPPDAIFCGMSSHVAPSVLAAIEARGIQIPEDMAFVMHDVDDSGEVFEPKVTSAGCSNYILGREAAMLLTRIMQTNPATPVQIVLPPHVVYRDSTPARKKRSAA